MDLPTTLTPGVVAQRSDEEEMTFRPSPKPTVGVELELQILDRDSGDLAPGAVPLLKACREEGLAGVTAELMQSMIEIKTGVCHQVSEIRNELVPSLRRVRNLASSFGYDLAMAGDRQKALEAGCDDYETKPVEFARLLAKIQSLLDKNPR